MTLTRFLTMLINKHHSAKPRAKFSDKGARGIFEIFDFVFIRRAEDVPESD